MLCQDLKPNGHKMEENWVLAGLGISGPTAKSSDWSPRRPKSWHGCSLMYGLFNCTTENTQKMQYQDVEATDQLPCLAKYLTRHSTHEKEILKDLSMAFETQKPMD